MALYQDIVKLKMANKLFIDLSTAKPKIKNKISNMIVQFDSKYVDVAVLGSVTKKKHRVPMMLSGSGAKEMMNIFAKYSMDMKIIGDEAGQASIVKLCRSIYMKGLAAITIEMTEVADAYGVKDLVYSSLANSMDNDEFNIYSPRLIQGTRKHLARRTSEVEECIELVENAGISPFMTRATFDLYTSLFEQ